MRRIIAVRTRRRNDSHSKPKEVVHLSHPRAVTTREVVVNRDHMHALPGQRVEGRGQSRDERLTLAGAHLSDFPFDKRKAADELYVEVWLRERAA